MIMWMFKNPFGSKLKNCSKFLETEISEREYHVSTNSTRTTYTYTDFNTFRVVGAVTAAFFAIDARAVQFFFAIFYT